MLDIFELLVRVGSPELIINLDLEGVLYSTLIFLQF